MSTLSMLTYMLVPGVIMVARNLIDFEEPDNVFVLRVVAASVTAACALLLVYFYIQIITSPRKDTTLFVRPSQLYSPEMQAFNDPGASDAKFEMTFRDYDLVKLKDLGFKLAMTAFMTYLVHWYFEATPALVAAVFVQPRLLFNTAFFRIYVRGQDDRLHRELKRPWPDPTPGFAQRWQKKYTDYLRDLDADPAAVGDAAQAATAAAKRPGKKGKRHRVKA